ncbi:MAG: exosortase system-associated protein, TIGR04073 family [Nitrosomonas sp.]|nr:exosortase system-associated protein, TIGR04073 family [Nitrosomonas sp.]
MKIIAKLSLILSFLFICSSHAIASSGYISGAGEKLVNGVVNVATGTLELPKNIVVSSVDKGVAYGFSVGIITGVMHSIARTAVGALDVVTFLLPTGPSIHPNYIWQDVLTETSY